MVNYVRSKQTKDLNVDDNDKDDIMLNDSCFKDYQGVEEEKKGIEESKGNKKS